MEKLKKIWNRLLKEETGAVCVGCGLTTSGGLLIVQLQPNSGLECDNTTGLAVNRSEDACNGLEKRANGLYVPCPDSIVGSEDVGGVGALVPPFAITAPNTYEFISDCAATDTTTCVVGGGGFQFQLCNTLCCTVRGMWDAQVYGGLITGASANFDAIVLLSVSINNGAYFPASPNAAFRIYGAAGPTHDLSNMEDVNFVELAPAACIAFSAKISVQVLAGSATWSTGPTFEFHWHLTQTGCC